MSRRLLTAAALALLLGPLAATFGQSPAGLSLGHQRMLNELREIYDRMDEDNHCLGNGAAEASRRNLQRVMMRRTKSCPIASTGII